MALGLAAAIFLGGVLNLARLAFPWALFGMVLAGAAFALPAVLRGCRGGLSWTRSLVLVPIAVVLWFTIATQLPPRVYNCYDDFQKYFAYPVRMIETGTLLGSPFNGLGSETLGGEAFLHGFAAATLPLSYLNGVDAVFGLFLCLALAARFACGGRWSLGGSLVCLAAVVLINPQYVNVSTLYLGSALIMAAVLVSSSPAEMTGEGPGSAPDPAALGLVYAGLVALKSTFLLFVALHLPAAAVAVALASRGVRRALSWGLLAALSFAAFLSPWILLHAPHYWAAVRSAPAAPVVPPGPYATETLDLLSARPLPYGGSMVLYTGLVGALSICGLIAVWMAARSADGKARLSAWMVCAAAAAGAGAYLLLLCVAGPRLSGYLPALRYFTPFAIALAPAVFGLAAFHAGRSERSLPRFVRWGLVPALAAVSLAGFWRSLADRVGQAVETGSILSFSKLAREPAYLAVNRSLLDPSEAVRVAAAQHHVPAGAVLVAWINTPFHLDFARNPVVDVEPSGLATPWSRMPDARYFAWEYNGLATSAPGDYARQARGIGANERRAGLSCVVFGQWLENAARAGTVLYNDGHMVVFSLP
jgi:hypothetical protein